MGKKYIESTKLIDKSALYGPAEALELTVKTAKANFDETIESVSYTHLTLPTNSLV